MITRHATPALVCFCVLAAAFASTGIPGLSPFVMLIPASVGAAIGVILFTVSTPVFKRAGVLVLCGCVGALLAFSLHLRIENDALGNSLGMDRASITGFSGRLVQDSILTRTSKTMLVLDLVRTESTGLGIRAEARGSALLILDGDWRFAMGQVIAVHKGISASQADGTGKYIAFAKRNDLDDLGFSSPIWMLRNAFRKGIDVSLGLVGYPASALLEALVIGSREDIPADLSEGFIKTGSFHVLSLSGLNVAVIFALVGLLFGFSGSRALKFVLGTAVLVFYQFIAGPIPSLLRATIMLIIGGFGLILDRDGEPLNLLSIAGILILIVDPLQLRSLSFQLSFLALAGILAIGPLIVRPMEGRLPSGILSGFAASAGAQLATLPVIIVSFGAYYPSGLAASLVLVPLVTMFLWLGLFWLPASPLLVALGALQPPGMGAVAFAAGAAHHAVARMFDVLYSLISWAADGLSKLPGIIVSRQDAPVAAGLTAAAITLLMFLPLRGKSA
jgi:ComEC/Rec2-related protein